ncbi:hypothetical protein D3C75_1276770 [compost metagenome]
MILVIIIEPRETYHAEQSVGEWLGSVIAGSSDCWPGLYRSFADGLESDYHLGLADFIRYDLA